MTQIYTIKYEGKELCTCRTREDAEWIIGKIRYTAYNHDGVEEMEAADTLEIEESTE